MKKKRKRRIWMTLAILVLLAIMAIAGAVLINWSVLQSGRTRIYTRVESVPKTKVALVLGARVYSSGRLSAMLEDRVLSAVDLYNAGKVEKLLMSGDNSESHYDEVTAMRDYAIKQGVPSDDVVRDFAGFRTFDSIYRAKELWDQEELVIVTQRFHLSRSIYIARKLGVDAVGFVADRRDYQTASITHSRMRERFARISAWLDVNILRTKPHFLGPKESLSGDTQEAKQRAAGSR